MTARVSYRGGRDTDAALDESGSGGCCSRPIVSQLCVILITILCFFFFYNDIYLGFGACRAALPPERSCSTPLSLHCVFTPYFLGWCDHCSFQVTTTLLMKCLVVLFNADLS